MKSIKPGRYNSGQGIIASIIGLVFAIFWTYTAATMGAPVIFPIFGIGFIILMVTELIKNIHNFTGFALCSLHKHLVTNCKIAA